jgi:hypothetical protein
VEGRQEEILGPARIPAASGQDGLALSRPLSICRTSMINSTTVSNGPVTPMHVPCVLQQEREE